MKVRAALVGTSLTTLLLGTVAVAPAHANGGSLHDVQGSMSTVDGVPYANVKWRAATADGSLEQFGTTDDEGNFSFLSPDHAETHLSLGGGNYAWEAGSDSYLCSFSGSQYNASYLKVHPGQQVINLRTGPAHNNTILVTDKYGERVRNATVKTGGDSTPCRIGNNSDGGALVWPTSPPMDFDWRSPGESGSAHGSYFAGYIPGREGGTTDSSGRALVSTPGPIDPNARIDLAVVSATVRPGAVQSTRVPLDAAQGNDPQNRVAVAVLPYAPIMIGEGDAQQSGAERNESVSLLSTSAPKVRVTSPAGTPISGADVDLVRVLEGDTEEHPVESQVIQHATTNDHGRASFTGQLWAGHYRATPQNLSSRTVDFQVQTDTPPTTPPVAPPATPPVTPPPASDTTAPNTRITSGTSGKVSNRKAKFSFTSTEAGSKFQCKLDSGSWQRCTSTKSYSKLANGKHTSQVRATDKAGNTDRTPANQKFTTAVRAKVKLKAKNNRSKLLVDVNPNNKTKNYKIKVQQKKKGKWKTVRTTTTKGAKDKRTINLGKGTYRVVVPAQHDLLKAKSNSVKLRR